MPYASIPKSIDGGNHTLRYASGMGGGGGSNDGLLDEYRWWGGPGGVVIIKTDPNTGPPTPLGTF